MTDNGSEEKQLDMGSWNLDVDRIVLHFLKTFCYRKKEKQWYNLSNNRWMPYDSKDLAKEVLTYIKIHYDRLEYKYTPSMMDSLSKVMVKCLIDELPLKDEWLQGDEGIHFQNDYLLLKGEDKMGENTLLVCPSASQEEFMLQKHPSRTDGRTTRMVGCLHQHTYTRFVSYCFDVNYIHDLFPDATLKKRI